MNKGLRLIKKNLALILVLLLSIENFAAVVGDNDGAAFITKAEFDSLKNNFQAQIDQYNTSIDSKIDGAIAEYLSGMNVAKSSTEKFFDGNGAKVLVCDTAEIDDLKWGKFGLELEHKTFYCGPWSDSYGWYGALGLLWWKAERTARSPFECFRYNKTTKKLIAYSDDLEVTYKTNRSVAKFTNFTLHTTTDTSSTFGLRWHSVGSVYYQPIPQTSEAAARTWIWNNIRSNTLTEDMENYNTYNTYLHSPNWFDVWASGVNISSMGTVSGATHQWDLSDELIINNESKILTIFDDTSNDKENMLWTPASATQVSIELGALKSDGHPTDDDFEFAINYDKDGRTLRYDTPGSAGVSLTASKLWGLNTNQSKYFKYGTTLTWSSKNDTTGSYPSSYSADYWYEPYFENSKEYSKNIINASATNALLNTYGTYGWAGKIVEGIPVAEVTAGDEVSFDITLPDELVLGFMTVPFSVGTKVKDVPARADLEIIIDGTQVTTHASKLVSAGMHKVTLKYNGVDKSAIFFKIGRPAADDGKSDRYLVTLPTEFVRTSY